MQSKKRIVWFNSALQSSGGGERLSLEVLRCLSDLGLDVKYLTYYYNGDTVFDRQYEFLEIISREHKLPRITNLCFQITDRFRRILWLRKKFTNINPDLVITSGTWGHVVDVYLATLFTRIDYVTHIFGSMFAFTAEKEPLKYARIFRKNFNEVRQSVKSYQDVVMKVAPKAGMVTRLHREISAYVKYRAIRASKKLFVLSERNRWENQKIYGRDSIVLQGAFPARIFNYTPHKSLKKDLMIPDCKVILSVGRLAANKRVDLAIRAFADISLKQANTHLVIGGTGPEEGKLRLLVRELNLVDKVHFLGYVPEGILWDYLADCDVFLHLDLADYDIAPLEALAMGANVVWCNEMDLPNLTNQLSCLTSVPPEQVLIAEATLSAIKAGKSIVTSEERRQILESYTWESYSLRMISSCEDL